MHYTLLKFAIKFALRLFYHRYQVVGREHIPKEGGIIFVGNHQNALMDPFNIICHCGHEPYFATMGSVFQKNWMRRLLLAFKMYPVYRLRDGRQSMAQNEMAFEFFAGKLVEGGAVGIFPEGGAAYQHRLLPLKKGMARLAFRALEKKPDHKVYVVPVGLHYEHRHDYQADLLLQFGEPILVNDYFKTYRLMKPRALRQLTKEVQTRLSALMIDIQNTKQYDSINTLRQQHYRASSEDLLSRFRQGQKIVETPDAFKEVPRPASPWKIRYIIFFPILLAGLLFHYPPRRLFDYRSHATVKDSQFFATFKFAYGFLVFPVYYSLLAIAIGVFINPYWLMFLPILPLGGRWAYRLLHKIA